MLVYHSFRAITLLASTLPRGLQYSAACRLADLYRLMSPRARKAVKSNMRVILGEQASEATVRHETRWAFRSFGMYLCEFFGFRRFGPAYLDEHVRVVGREHLDRALASGHGCLLVSGHYSNWELGASMVGHMGYPILIVAQMHRDPRVNELFIGQRAKHGVTVAHTEQGAIAALRALRENRPVAILGDRPTGGPTVPVKLFGRPIPFPQGPWRLALSTGAPILPTFVRRNYRGGYTLEFDAPVTVPAGLPRNQAISAFAQRWAKVLEAKIAADPSQWAAFYEAWPETPSSGPSAGSVRPARSGSTEVSA
ncbi:MAG: lysophospholipid acyltransferase family protein [Planctomycetes bacterium]|nr:lysophospholipid acyltransferase family protein [Planctomycetota bacterium]